MELFIDVFLDAAFDCIRMLPFLFLAFFMLEALEHRVSGQMNDFLARAGGFGPLVGSILGFVPQCGFSIMASNFYAAGVISMGTLLSVYLSTSDEALVILMAEPEHFSDIGVLLVAKILIGTVGGYLVYALERRGFFGAAAHRKTPKDLCGEETEGETDEDIRHHPGEPAWKYIVWPAFNHTKEVFFYLFLFSFAIGLVMEGFGSEAVSRIFLDGSVFQPLLASIIGLIPNCAASVMLTRLYIEGVLSFGSAIAGLASSAGLGLLVLFRVNRDMKDNLTVLGLLVGISFLSGVILQFIL